MLYLLTILNFILVIALIYFIYIYIKKGAKDGFPIVRNETLFDNPNVEILSNKDIRNLIKSLSGNWHIIYFYSDKKGNEIFYYMGMAINHMELSIKFKNDKVISIKMKHPIRIEIKKFLKEFTKAIYPLYKKKKDDYNNELKYSISMVSMDITSAIPQDELRNDKLNDLLGMSEIETPESPS